MSEHAILAPSSAGVWGFCSGSVKASNFALDIDTPEKREGTAAHWVVAEVLTRWQRADGGEPSVFDYVGKRAPNGVVIDEMMAEGAQVMVEDVMAVAEKYGALQDIHVEERVHMTRIHPEHNWGTLDARIWLPSIGVMFLWDYKHGHRAVSPRGCLQLIDYFAGLTERLGIDGHAEQHTTVVMRIVQPYAYKPTGPVEEWVVLASDLRPYYNQLSAQAHEALSTKPTLTPGAHCRDCPARVPCRGNSLASYALADFARTPYQFDERTPEQLGTEYAILGEALTLLKARIAAIEEQIKDKPHGTGYTLQAKTGRLAWKVSAAVVSALCRSLGVDADKKDVKTPTQVLAGVKDENIIKAIKSVTERPSRGLTLVNAEDSTVYKAFQRKK